MNIISIASTFFRRYFLANCFVLSLLAASGAFVSAQEKDMPHELLNTSGVLKGAANGGLVVATESAGVWSVKLPMQRGRVSYSATADVEFLKPGMLIRFNAVISNKGVVQSEISAVTVFTPLENGDLGIKPEGNVGPNAAEGLFADDKVPKKPVKAPEELPCSVAGELVSLKGRKMVVGAGGVLLKCELAENAQVDVRVADLSWAQPGDKVELKAWFYPSNKALGAMGNEINVIAANPLVDLKKKLKTQPKTDEKKSEKLEAGKTEPPAEK